MSTNLLNNVSYYNAIPIYLYKHLVSRTATSWWTGCSSPFIFKCFCHLQKLLRLLSAWWVIFKSSWLQHNKKYKKNNNSNQSIKAIKALDTANPRERERDLWLQVFSLSQKATRQLMENMWPNHKHRCTITLLTALQCRNTTIILQF